MANQQNLVRRLIAFLKKPDALDYAEPVHNSYDDFEPRDDRAVRELAQPSPAAIAPEPIQSEAVVPDPDPPPRPPVHVLYGRKRSVNHASRLDTLVMRSVIHFHAHAAYLIRTVTDEELRYCTGRNLNGDYIEHSTVCFDQRILNLTLDSGEAQLYQTYQDSMPLSVLCGPIWSENDHVIGVLYLENPARKQLHRGVFDVFCDQAARLLAQGEE